MSQLSALVYLEHDDVNQIASETLEANGFSVRTAASPREVGRFCDEGIDLLFVDGPLGSTKSVETVAWLRKAGCNVPAVFICHSKTEARTLQSEAHLRPLICAQELDQHAIEQIKAACNKQQSAELPWEGTLGHFEFDRIVVWALRNRWSGKVELEYQGTPKAVYFHDGLPVNCYSRIFSENFGQMLLRRGVITEVEYEWARKIHMREGIRQGEALVKIGVLSNQDLFDLLRQQIHDKVVNIYGWNNASYRMVDDDGFLHRVTKYSFNPVEIAIEAREKFLTEEEVTACWQGMQTHYCVANPSPTTLTQAAQQVLTRGAIELFETPRGISETVLDLRWSKARGVAVFGALEGLGFIKTAESRLALPSTTLQLSVQASSSSFIAVDNKEQAQLAERLWQAYLRITSSDNFAAIGVGQDAPFEEVTMVADELLENYTDENFSPILGDARVQKALGEIRDKITHARDVLCDPIERRAYIAVANMPASQNKSTYAAEDEFAKGKSALETNTEHALEHFVRANTLSPGEPLYILYEGWARFKCAHTDDERRNGKHLMTKAVALDPKMDQGYVFLAKYYLEAGDFAEAEDQAKAALSFNADNEAAQAVLEELRSY